MSPKLDARTQKPLLARLESSVRSVLEFEQAFNRQDLPAMLAVCSEDCHLETASPPPDGSSCDGLEQLSRHWQEHFGSAPHAQRKIEDIFGLGLHCVVRWRIEREQSGVASPLRGVDIFQVREGLICEIFTYVKGEECYFDLKKNLAAG